MDLERKIGLSCLIIGILCFILIFVVDGLMGYIFYVVGVPNLLYGIGSFLIPKTRRKDVGKLPFRGF
ncbi:hypothetical protein ACPB8Q_01430 [Methanocaldococcus indicus]|uniref:hypothetical protein n=1 Tax=Methanocaldococcus indicus TaxID=213231 RepID=UPI003C6D6316